ncbi:MAG TPA: MlaD family protein [Thermoanaerobaculia bacterium]|nr:MlaD family protein [Thermoanaerobaculia bacterium]
MSTTAKIGAFFLVVLLLLAGLILRIEDIAIGKRARAQTVEVHFEDVTGLDDKSAARIAGVRVGKVDGIRLLPDGTAVVRIALDPGIELRSGATGQIRGSGFLGDKWVDLFPGPLGAARLGSGARIEGRTSSSMDDLSKMASDIGKDVKELTTALSASLGGSKGEEKINRIVENLGRLAESMANAVDANRHNVDVTLANLKTFSAAINETLNRIDRILDENRSSVKGSLANIDAITDKLKTTVDNLNSITTKMDQGKGTVGKLLNDEETITNLNETMKSVKSGVDEVNKALTQVRKVELQFGFRGEYLTRGSTGNGFFTLDIMPNENRFYRFELAALSQGKRITETSYVTITNPDGSRTTTQYDTETFQDKLAISAQMGWREKNTIFRAGLFESRGGVGIDQILWNDKLRLTGEIWDFDRTGLNPQLKLYGRWVPVKNFFLTAGVAELLNAQSRSVVLGAGFSWTDERVKSLLGTVTLFK